MPRMDGTGPLGQGARTGRMMGECVGFKRGIGRCLGMGRRFFSEKNEISVLEEEEKALLKELEMIKEEKKALKAKK